MRALVSLLVLSLMACASSVSFAEPVEPPCEGCLLELRGADEPLVVVLHGDEGTPQKVFAAWRPHTSVSVFAPRCPRSLGCQGSWWRADPEFRWLVREVRQVEDASDELFGQRPRQVLLSAWSGGATYAGRHADEWSPTFMAVSLAGGGASAPGGRCAETPLPVHYLIGERNPLFHLAESTKAYLDDCGHEVTWLPLAGADHSAAWRHYVAAIPTIANWLGEHATRPPPPEPAVQPTGEPASTATGAPPPRTLDDEETPVPPPFPAREVSPPSRRRTCVCTQPGGDPSEHPWAAAVALVLAIATRRRFRSRT